MPTASAATQPTATNRPTTRRTVPRVTAQGSIQLVEAAAPRARPVTRAASATDMINARAPNAPVTRSATARVGVAPGAAPVRASAANSARTNVATTRSTTAATRAATATTRTAAARGTTSTGPTTGATTATRTSARSAHPPHPPSVSAQIMRTPSSSRVRGTAALLHSSSHNSNRGLGRTSSNASLMLPPPPPPPGFAGMQPPPTFSTLPQPPSFAMIPATPSRRPRQLTAAPATPLSMGSGDDSGAFLRVGTLPAPPMLQGQNRSSIGNVSLETSFGAPETIPLWARTIVEESPVVASPLNRREKRAARVAARAAAVRESTPLDTGAGVLAAIEAGASVTVADNSVDDVSMDLASLTVEAPSAVSSEESGAESAGASTIGSVAPRQRAVQRKKKAKGKRKAEERALTFTLDPPSQAPPVKETAAPPTHGIKRERDMDEPKRAPVITDAIQSVLAAREQLTPEQSRANAEDWLQRMRFVYEGGAWAPDRAHSYGPAVGMRGPPLRAYVTSSAGKPWGDSYH